MILTFLQLRQPLIGLIPLHLQDLTLNIKHQQAGRKNSINAKLMYLIFITIYSVITHPRPRTECVLVNVIKIVEQRYLFSVFLMSCLFS